MFKILEDHLCCEKDIKTLEIARAVIGQNIEHRPILDLPIALDIYHEDVFIEKHTYSVTEEVTQ